MSMDVSELKARKQEIGMSNKTVARLSGVPLSTVQKIFGGKTKKPREATLKEIEKALFPRRYMDAKIAEMEQKLSDAGLNDYMYLHDSGNMAVCPDRTYLYKVDASRIYTVRDYFDLPDDVRMELIDGRLYYLAAPKFEHQLIISLILGPMLLYKNTHDSTCLIVPSPVDVQLNCDDFTMLQPDIVVLCDEAKIRNGIVFGAPDLVIEILSPSTRERDLIIKLNIYWKAGVKEYWIVDPHDKTVMVYEFSKGIPPAKYTFDDAVPVGLSEGELAIDFRPIQKELNRISVRSNT